MLHSRLAGMMPWTLLRHNNQRTNPAALNMARIGRMWKIGIAGFCLLGIEFEISRSIKNRV